MKIAHLGVILAVSTSYMCADSIPIVNPSFETPDVAPGGITKQGIPGWTFQVSGGCGAQGCDNGSAQAGVANLPASQFVPPTDGSQVGYITTSPTVSGTSAVLLQTVPATLTANTTYALSVDIFQNLDAPVCSFDCPQFFIGILAGPANAPATLALITAQPGTNTVVFDATLTNIGNGAGQPLTIELEVQFATGASAAYFDNVRMQQSPTVNTSGILHGAFGNFGIITGETGRLNALCDGSVTPAPCQATLEFHDMHGVLQSQSHLTLRPGESGFLDLPAVQRGSGPMEISPCWFLVSGNMVTSFEVFDTDLRTRLFVNWGDGSVAKTGHLDSGPAFITRTETARLKAFCDGSVRTSCTADLSFHDASGMLLKESRLTLAPGVSGFLDLNYEDTHSTDLRVAIMPSLLTGESPAIGGFALLDSATGATRTQSYPAAIQSVTPNP